MTDAMISAVRTRLRSHPLWVEFRGYQREGFSRAFRRLEMWRRILRTAPVVTQPVTSNAPAEVHILCYRRDYLTAMWALKTFYRYAPIPYPLVIHFQGECPPIAIDRLRKHFPGARVILQPEADRRTEAWLAQNGCTRLLESRRKNPFLLKLTDIPIVSSARRIVVIDSDILFFREPAHLYSVIGSDLSTPLVQRDPESTYNITEKAAHRDLGIELAPCVNSGILVFDRQAHLDLRLCEELLGHPEVGRSTGWIEQTLYALSFSRSGGVQYLPDSYVISLESRAVNKTTVARHYAGPSRPYLT
ncbi:MAG TPA: hypothetical protein VEQ63_00710, partial [Bryobacteraceae bacterium]|nr:hypothetical protein [Bryobacteraceae bacterium]